MVTETNLLLFVGASLALLAVPGPDTIFVLTRGISGGRKVALASAAGVCVGLCLHTVFAAVGLSAVLRESALAFSVVKYAGACYLVYLGVRTFLSKDGFDLSGGAGPPATLPRFFLQGVASDLLNPKVALFFLAYLPQFVSPTAGGAAPQMLLLGSVFALLALVVVGGIALFSGAVGEWLGGRPRFADRLRWFTGGVFVCLGLRLALPDRR